MTVLLESDTATVSDGTGRSAFVAICGFGDSPWGVVCGGDPNGCKVLIVGYARQSQGIRAGEWHLKWHRNGEPRCRDCGADLGRKGATRCRPGRCETS